jgi:hypothetical protein
LQQHNEFTCPSYNVFPPFVNVFPIVSTLQNTQSVLHCQVLPHHTKIIRFFAVLISLLPCAKGSLYCSLCYFFKGRGGGPASRGGRVVSTATAATERSPSGCLVVSMTRNFSSFPFKTGDALSPFRERARARIACWRLARGQLASSGSSARESRLGEICSTPACAG